MFIACIRETVRVDHIHHGRVIFTIQFLPFACNIVLSLSIFITRERSRRDKEFGGAGLGPLWEEKAASSSLKTL